MDVDEVLSLDTDELGALRSPVMLVALTGLFDVGGAATGAIARLTARSDSVTVGEIDPDPFYDFTQARPYVVIDRGERQIRWPSNRIDVVRAGRRDLVVVTGEEPHLHWRTFADCVLRATTDLGCEAVITVGAFADAVPHTRPPRVTASTTDARLGAALGVGGPSYQGPTGVAGVLQVAFARAHVPAFAVRVGVPHYLMNTEQPGAVIALSQHVASVLGLEPVGIDDDDQREVAAARRLHDEVVSNDEQLLVYTESLERQYDHAAAASMPSADQLGAQFETFLRSVTDDDAGQDDAGRDDAGRDDADEPGDGSR